MTPKQMIIHLLKHIALGLFLIICYSPGYLNLRPNDPSILRAGCSILALPFGIFGFVYMNRQLLGMKTEYLTNPFRDDGKLDTRAIRKILEKQTANPYLRELAETAMEQSARLERISEKLSDILDIKFQKGAMACNKYQNTAAYAENALLQNQGRIAAAMNLFDPAEYRSLLNYENDSLPDRSQIEQLKLYGRNKQRIEQAIADTEQLLTKLYALTLIINDSLFEESSETDTLIAEIETLSKELEFYN